MDPSKYKTLERTVAQLRSELVPSDFGVVPSSVPFLQAQLQNTTDRNDRLAFYLLLLGEATTARNDALQLFVIRQRALEFTEDPLAQAGLGYGVAVAEPSQDSEAYDAAVRAMDIALQTNRLINYTALNAVRVGLSIKSFGLVERALEVLVVHAGQPRTDDIPLEFDFLDKMNPDECNQDIVKKYASLQRNSRRK